MKETAEPVHLDEIVKEHLRLQNEIRAFQELLRTCFVYMAHQPSCSKQRDGIFGDCDCGYFQSFEHLTDVLEDARLKGVK